MGRADADNAELHNAELEAPAAPPVIDIAAVLVELVKDAVTLHERELANDLAACLRHVTSRRSSS